MTCGEVWRGVVWRGRTLVCFSKSCVSASAGRVSPGGASANGRQYRCSICECSGTAAAPRANSSLSNSRSCSRGYQAGPLSHMSAAGGIKCGHHALSFVKVAC